jgi:hypothetical protein
MKLQARLAEAEDTIEARKCYIIHKFNGVKDFNFKLVFILATFTMNQNEAYFFILLTNIIRLII